MTSVRNRLPQLSGNRWLTVLFAMLFLGACSPKIAVQQWVSNPANKPVEDKPAKVEKATPPPVVKRQAKPTVISLLMPFGLDHIGPGQSYTDISLKKARIAADYYRGFELALDSLTYFGYNYKLQLFDTQDNIVQARNMATNQKVRSSDLIVGPVFPEDISAFTGALSGLHKIVVSPLAPESPATFKEQNLVTVNPPLEYHAWGAAQYISDRIKPQKIFILKSGFTEDEAYIIPFKKAIDSLGKGHIKLIMLTVVRGRLNTLIPQLAANKENVFVIPSTNQAFLMVTLHSLDTLAKHYPVTLFGHPSWEHFSFLKVAVLQHLKTHITSADHVDYKSAATIAFIKNYRAAWLAEPTAYALKGFDEGLYFGRLAAADNLKEMGKQAYTGMHNSFSFQKKAGLGWVNTHVSLLEYNDFQLKRVQ